MSVEEFTSAIFEFVGADTDIGFSRYGRAVRFVTFFHVSVGSCKNCGNIITNKKCYIVKVRTQQQQQKQA